MTSATPLRWIRMGFLLVFLLVMSVCVCVSGSALPPSPSPLNSGSPPNSSFIMNSYFSNNIGQRVSLILAMMHFHNQTTIQYNAQQQPYIQYNNSVGVHEIPLVNVGDSMSSDPLCAQTSIVNLLVNTMVGSGGSGSPISRLLAMTGVECNQAINFAKTLLPILGTYGQFPMIIPRTIPTDANTNAVFGNFFPTGPSITPMSALYMKLISSFGWTHVALVIYDGFDGAWSGSLLTAAAASYPPIRVTASVTPKPGASYTSILQQLAASGTRIFLFINTYEIDGGLQFLLAAYQYGLVGPGYVWISTNPNLCASLPSLTPQQLRAVDGLFCPSTPSAPTWFRTQYMALLQQLYPTNYINTSYALNPDNYVLDYDIQSMLLQAIDQSETNQTVDVPAAITHSLKTQSYNRLISPTLTSPFSWTNPQQSLTWGIVQVLSDASYTITNQLCIRTDIQNVTRCGVAPFYFVGTAAGVIPSDGFNVVITSTSYNLDDASETALVVLSGIIMTLPIAAFIIVMINRHSRIIYSSSTVFLSIFLMGCIGLCVSVLLIVVTQSTSSVCMAKHWVFNLSFGLTYLSLFIKSYRMDHIFNSQVFANSRHLTSNRRLVGLMMGMLCYDMIILICWNVISPLQSVDQVGQHTCVSSSSDAVLLIYQILLYVPKVILVSGIMLIAYRIRTLPKQFNETNSLYAVTGNTLLAAVLVVLLTLTSHVSVPAQKTVIAVAILYAVMINVCVIIVPKVWTLYRQYDKAHQAVPDGVTVLSQVGSTGGDENQNSKQGDSNAPNKARSKNRKSSVSSRSRSDPHLSRLSPNEIAHQLDTQLNKHKLLEGAIQRAQQKLSHLESELRTSNNTIHMLYLENEYRTETGNGVGPHSQLQDPMNPMVHDHNSPSVKTHNHGCGTDVGIAIGAHSHAHDAARKSIDLRDRSGSMSIHNQDIDVKLHDGPGTRPGTVPGAGTGVGTSSLPSLAGESSDVDVGVGVGMGMASSTTHSVLLHPGMRRSSAPSISTSQAVPTPTPTTAHQI